MDTSAVQGWTIVVMDQVPEDGDVCSIEKPRAGGREHPDGSHPLSQAFCCAR